MFELENKYRTTNNIRLYTDLWGAPSGCVTHRHQVKRYRVNILTFGLATLLFYGSQRVCAD